MYRLKYITVFVFAMSFFYQVNAQLENAQLGSQKVRIVQEKNAKKINVFIGDKLFTTFFYPDTLDHWAI